MTFEDAAAKIESKCKLYREIVQLVPVIRSVLVRFDKKVFNKRFETAVNQAAEKQFGKELFITVNRSSNGQRVFVYGHKRMHYNECPCLCQIDLTEEKRIDAASGLRSCGEKYAEVLKECTEKESCIQDMPQIIARLDELYKLQQAIVKQIPRSLYYDYDIKHVLEYGAAWVFPELREENRQAG